MLLKLKCWKFKKNNNWENYFIDFKSKSKSKSNFRYPNNGISNPSLYKKTQTKNLKINGFQIKVFKSINFKINGFQIKQIEWLYNIFIVIFRFLGHYSLFPGFNVHRALLLLQIFYGHEIRIFTLYTMS